MQWVKNLENYLWFQKLWSLVSFLKQRQIGAGCDVGPKLFPRKSHHLSFLPIGFTLNTNHRCWMGSFAWRNMALYSVRDLHLLIYKLDRTWTLIHSNVFCNVYFLADHLNVLIGGSRMWRMSSWMSVGKAFAGWQQSGGRANRKVLVSA